MAVAIHESGVTSFPFTGHAQATVCPIMVIDRQPLVRAGLVSLIEAHLGHGSVCFSGATIRGAIDTAQTLDGACAVLGTRRNEQVGHEIESIATLVMHGIEVLVLVEETSGPSLEAAKLAGAKGYLDKASTPSEFITAVRRLATGQSCPSVSRVSYEPQTATQVRLSHQERRALVLYASGLTQDVVARRMGIAPNTVKHYLDRVRTKYGHIGIRARTKLELHAIARAEGLLP